MRYRVVAVLPLAVATLALACSEREVSGPASKMDWVPQNTVLLTSTGAFLITPNALDFGAVQTGGTSAPQTVTVTNLSSAAVTVSMSGGLPGGAFSASQNCADANLAPGASCQIVYAFGPASSGEFSAASVGTLNGQDFSIALHGTGAAPKFLITPTALEFGLVPTGATSAEQVVTVTNAGGAATVVSMASGAPDGPFNASQNCQGVTLEPAASCQFTYSFAPTTSGGFTASSSGTINDQPFEITLHGIGSPPELLVTPAGLDFGDVMVDAISPAQVVRVKNAGSAAVTLSVTSGESINPFSVSHHCQGVTLAPGEFCEFTYEFAPFAPFTMEAVSGLNINGTAYPIALKGSGFDFGSSPSAQFQISPVSLQFGNLPVGVVSAEQVVFVRNISWAPVVVDMAGGTPGEPFSALHNCQGVTLAPGVACAISFTFRPQTTDAFESFSVGTVNGQAFSIRLQGAAVAPGLRVSPTALEFGDVSIGTTSPAQTVTVTNTSAAPITVDMVSGAPGAPFKAAQNCQGVSLAPNASCQMSYTFEPEGSGAAAGTSAGTINGQAFSISLRGTGAVPRFLITPVGLEFGPVLVGATAPQQVVSVTNVSSAPVTVELVGGTLASPFNAAQNCQGVTLAVGASCLFSYNFAPTGAGAFAGNSVGSVNGQTFDVALSGTGVEETAQPPAAAYTVLPFEPPLTSRALLQTGNVILVRFAVADEAGTLLTNEEATALEAACAVRVRIAEADYSCATYHAGGHRFSVLLRVPAELLPGERWITAEVVNETGEVVGSRTLDVVVRARK